MELEGMNPQYFLGYQPDTSGPFLSCAQGINPSKGQLLPSPPVIPHKPETLRKRPRKQKVLTVSQMNARDEYLGARNEKKQADVRRKEELAAAGLRRRMAVAQQDTQKMVEEKKVDRSNRRQAMVKRQQTTQQQREAAEAQRAAEKEAAAAARRKAAVQCTADLDQGMLVGQQPEQAESSLSSRFVQVPKSTLYGKSGTVASRAARDGPARASSSSSVNQGSSGCPIMRQPAPRAPDTPSQNRSSRANPSSPTMGESQVGLVLNRNIGGGQGQVNKEPVYCRCCFVTSAPTWRRGGLQPYRGHTLCNACRIWEERHGKLSASNKVDRHKEEFHANYEWVAEENRFLPRLLLEDRQGQDKGMADQLVFGDLEVGGSGSSGTEEAAADHLAEAAASTHAEVQHSGVSAENVSCSAADHQHVQPLNCSKEESLTCSVIRHSRKRSAASVLLKSAAKRQAQLRLPSKDAAVSLKDNLGIDVTEIGSSAAGVADIKSKGTKGPHTAGQQRRLLRARKSMDRVSSGHT